MTRLDTLDKIHPDLISAFLTTGKCDGIPADVQLFLKQLQWAAEIYEYERNITRAAKQLRQRINAQQQINVDERTCKARIYAAINYFNIDNNVSIKVWESNYADKYEDLPNYVRLPVTTRPRQVLCRRPGVPSPCRRDCRSRP
jgi:hypothetical protein